MTDAAARRHVAGRDVVARRAQQRGLVVAHAVVRHGLPVPGVSLVLDARSPARGGQRLEVAPDGPPVVEVLVGLPGLTWPAQLSWRHFRRASAHLHKAAPPHSAPGQMRSCMQIVLS